MGQRWPSAFVGCAAIIGKRACPKLSHYLLPLLLKAHNDSTEWVLTANWTVRHELINKTSSGCCQHTICVYRRWKHKSAQACESDDSVSRPPKWLVNTLCWCVDSEYWNLPNCHSHWYLSGLSLQQSLSEDAPRNIHNLKWGVVNMLSRVDWLHKCYTANIPRICDLSLLAWISFLGKLVLTSRDPLTRLKVESGIYTMSLPVVAKDVMTLWTFLLVRSLHDATWHGKVRDRINMFIYDTRLKHHHWQDPPHLECSFTRSSAFLLLDMEFPPSKPWEITLGSLRNRKCMEFPPFLGELGTFPPPPRTVVPTCYKGAMYT